MKTSPTPLISLVVAAAENGAIGKDNQLLWHLPNDLRFFKNTTTGHSIIMGRKTFQSIGKPLPNRRNIVISRQSALLDPASPGQAQIEQVASVDEALTRCKYEKEVFIIGGAQIYQQTLDIADRVYLTRVHAEIQADVFFPDLDDGNWTTVHKETHPADEKHRYSYSFIILERKR